jgi:hypothetical protein
VSKPALAPIVALIFRPHRLSEGASTLFLRHLIFYIYYHFSERLQNDSRQKKNGNESFELMGRADFIYQQAVHSSAGAYR